MIPHLSRFLFLFLGVLILAILFSHFFIINTTASFPYGIYRQVSGEAREGDLVQICPRDDVFSAIAVERGYLATGLCPGGYGYLIKRILAAKTGDRVLFSDDGIWLNGLLLPNSRPQRRDSLGRYLPRLRSEKILSEDEILVLSDHEQSYDSRYFGILKNFQIRSKLKPLFIWDLVD
jgi:conjugative transfer signal peptidase TraF